MLIVLMIFSIATFFVNMYITMYGLKSDLYNLNRNVIMSVNVEKGNLGQYEYLRSEYYNRFVELLKSIYKLNDNFENKDRNISKIEIQEYVVYSNGEFDSVTKKQISKSTIHCVVEVTYIPVLFNKLFENGFKIKLHNDISIKEYNG